MAETKGLRFEVPILEGDTMVMTERRDLRQILLNLTGNAIKFTSIGSVRLEVRQRNGKRNTEISVLDTGIGLRPEDVAQLFQAFSRVDSETTRRSEGTGLGLHLSQKLAQLLAGHISVESEY